LPELGSGTRDGRGGVTLTLSVGDALSLRASLTKLFDFILQISNTKKDESLVLLNSYL
jgi:hypothetical protein